MVERDAKGLRERTIISLEDSRFSEEDKKIVQELMSEALYNAYGGRIFVTYYIEIPDFVYILFMRNCLLFHCRNASL